MNYYLHSLLMNSVFIHAVVRHISEGEVAHNLSLKRTYSVVDAQKYMPDWLTDYI